VTAQPGTPGQVFARETYQNAGGMELRTSNPNQRHEEIVCALAIAHNVNSVHQTGKRRLGCPDVGGNL
jgi:hypothetical protein